MGCHVEKVRVGHADLARHAMGATTKHPMAAGWLAGSLEITVTYPLEYVKTQLQLQQRASAMYAGADRYAGTLDCIARTVRERGFAGLYRGGGSWILFAGPRSAVRFGAFDALSSASRRYGLEPSAAVDTTCGFFAGIVEAALCQTPNQCIAIKMTHDAAPRGPRRYRSLLHACRTILAEDGFFGGFYAGLAPAVLKGAVTNCLRFLGYGAITRTMVEQRGGDRSAPLPASHTLLAGGLAGAFSAVVSQPIDTVKANMMGLEAKEFTSSFACARQIVAAGGVRALFFGVGPRACRVFIEVGLQFTLFDRIGRLLERF